MATKSPRRLSDEERDERRCADRERLQHAAEQLLTSEGWQRWVRVRSRAGLALARLSVSNQLLVALARPDATFVAGFKAWLQLGYCVKKGERAIAIIAPLPIKDRDKLSGDETGETRLLFKTVFVFDREQVEPLPDREPTQLGPPSQPLTGDSHQHLITPPEHFAASVGFRTWLKLGRCVRKGEVALRILAPVTLKQRDEFDDEMADARRVFFKTAFGFDVSQTDVLDGLVRSNG